MTFAYYHTRRGATTDIAYSLMSVYNAKASKHTKNELRS